jgi:hypothetical protein
MTKKHDGKVQHLALVELMDARWVVASYSEGAE